MSGPVALPPAPPPVLAGTSPQPAPAAGTLSGSPEILAALVALGRSDSITAMVLSAGDASAPAQLLTDLGIVAIETPLPLPMGAVVTLQPAPDQPGAVAILAVDGTAPRGPAAAPDAAPAPAPAEPPSAIIALGTLVSAIVVADTALAPDAAALLPSPEIAQPTPPAPPAAGAASSGPPAAPQATAASLSPVAVESGAASTVPSAKSTVVADTLPIPRILSPGLLLLQEVAAEPAALPVAATPASPQGEPPATPGESARPAATAASDISPPAPPAVPPRRLPPGTGLALRILAAQPPATPAAVAPPGAAFLGGVIRSLGRGAAIVETAAGPLTLTPAPPLARGTPVTLRLVPGGPSASVTVAALAAETPRTLVTPAAPAVPPAAAEAALPATPAAPPHPPNLYPEAPNAAATATKPGEVAGSPPAAAASQYRVALPSTGMNDAGGAPLAVIGTVLAEPAEAAPTATLVATPLGRLAIAPRLALPPGTLLLLALPDPILAPAPTDPSRPAQESWPALHAALSVLGRAAPDLAHQLNADLAAGAGEKLAAALLLVVAALRGDTRIAWPGAEIDRALAVAGRGDVTTQLANDVGALRQIAADPATAPWQVFLLPVVDGPAIRPLHLYIKERGARSGRGRRGQEESTRFILEFELSRIGALQLDGFVRPRRFDLVLRSHRALAPPLRGEVTRIFHDRIAAAGIAGEIEFATSARFEVAPLEARRRPVGLAV